MASKSILIKDVLPIKINVYLFTDLKILMRCFGLHSLFGLNFKEHDVISKTSK